MKRRCLIMSEWSVQRMLAGGKTQTRRLSGLNEVNMTPDAWEYWRVGMMDVPRLSGIYATFRSKDGGEWVYAKCPFGSEGDKFYVKETWQYNPYGGIVYRAMSGVVDRGGLGWRSSIFMPAFAARPELNRVITEIRVGRIQEISEEDCFAEGLRMIDVAGWWKVEFRTVWNDLHAKPKPVRANSRWAKLFGWKEEGKKVVGYISFPFLEKDGDLRKMIRGKPHYRCVNPWAWILTFVREKDA